MNAARTDFARSRVAALSPDSIQIQRPTPAIGASGGVARTWSAVATVAGHRQVSATRTRESSNAATRPIASSQWDIYLPVGTDVRAQDRLIAGGVTYEVEAVAAPDSLAAYLLIHASEVH